MKKIKYKHIGYQCLCFSVLVSTLFSSMPLTIFAENLSPLPAVTRSSNISEQSESENNIVESASHETEVSETAIPVDIENPSSLLTLLYAKSTPTNTTLTLFESVKQESMKGAGYTELRKDNVRYVQRTDSTKLPLSAVLIAKDSEIEVYQPVDDLMTFSVELMKSQAEGLQGTVIADLTQYISENSDQLVGKFLQLGNKKEVLALSDEFVMWHRYFETVLHDWLANQPVPTKNENSVLTYELQGELAEQFTAVMRRHEAEFPELEAVFSRFKERYDGTVALDFKEQQLAVGLIEGEAVIEYYLRFQDTPLTPPEADKILTADQFRTLTGIDWEAGLVSAQERLIQ